MAGKTEYAETMVRAYQDSLTKSDILNVVSDLDRRIAMPDRRFSQEVPAICLCLKIVW